MTDPVRAKVAKLKREVGREPRRQPSAAEPLQLPRWRALLNAVAFASLKAAVIVALPFIVLVRAAVYYYLHVGLAPWLSLGAGALFALLVVAGYATWLSRRFITLLKWVALPLVAGWCVYAMVSLRSANAKTDAVRGYYLSVHPVLRVALSTVILADPHLVITDLARTREDYPRMGLPVFDRTLHYAQRDGWVHAVDLRTGGRNEIKNLTVQAYFRIMGFDTFRHVGTADHLHVELPVR